MAGDDLLQVVAGILDKVEAIGDLQRLRRARSTALRGAAAAVPTDHFHPWVRDKPGGEDLRGALGEEVDRAVTLQVNEHRAVALPLAPGPVVYA